VDRPLLRASRTCAKPGRRSAQSATHCTKQKTRTAERQAGFVIARYCVELGHGAGAGIASPMKEGRKNRKYQQKYQQKAKLKHIRASTGGSTASRNLQSLNLHGTGFDQGQ
jgi:hypothetical protein